MTCPRVPAGHNPQNKDKAMIRHPKKRGEWVEMQFMARATAYGLTVSKPWGDSVMYDFVVEGKRKFQRVQVKSSMTQNSNDFICSCHPPTRTTQAYRASEIDFLVAYLIPVDLWYVIPVRVFAHHKY